MGKHRYTHSHLSRKRCFTRSQCYCWKKKAVCSIFNLPLGKAKNERKKKKNESLCILEKATCKCDAESRRAHIFHPEKHTL